MNGLLNERWMQYKDTSYYLSDEGRVKHVLESGKVRILDGYRKTNWKGHSTWMIKIAGEDLILKNIMWETFKGSIPKGYIVVHKNGCITMNDIYNLELITPEEAGKRYGGKTRLTRRVINKDNGKVYTGTRQAGEALNISRQTVSDYCNNKIKKPMYNLKWAKERPYEKF